MNFHFGVIYFARILGVCACVYYVTGYNIFLYIVSLMTFRTYSQHITPYTLALYRSYYQGNSDNIELQVYSATRC
jgi:hypothetical protein